MRAIGILLTLFFAHFIGDFVFQSRDMAENKSKHLGTLMQHCFIVYLTLFLAAHFIGLETTVAIKFALLNAVLHGLIDANIWKLCARRMKEKGQTFRYWKDYWFYTTIGFDQFLHVSIMFLVLMAVI